ncbi:unnamed protein product [Bursaphelenchus okinawaensis]|uniref:HAT C-terminal dimerisation domain-containing protein n=1 Tax=Bursaphelenchus okinawaensis TaxID=465554 RepID=A0A811K185_9BILA|nr:unnamed protein product [Bursaphelenchus okinawaensis]CAG9089764.1 unnamed protein product [Bursaphelenchus okinawaensis]
MKAIKLRNVIPEEFWKDNNDRFPILYQVAKKVMCIPPSSVPSERFFSHATMLFNDKLRNRLTDERAEQILLLRCELNRRNKELNDSSSDDENDGT